MLVVAVQQLLDLCRVQRAAHVFHDSRFVLDLRQQLRSVPTSTRNSCRPSSMNSVNARSKLPSALGPVRIDTQKQVPAGFHAIDDDHA
jgi:hypothetical protein